MWTIGAAVMGRWSNGQWYPGTITETDGEQYFVQFDDGDSAWLGAHQLRAIDGAGGPAPYVGARVSGMWSNGEWYPGTVTEARGERYFVRFDDGDTAWLVAAKLRVQAPASERVAAPAGPVGPGARVSAEWVADAWYDGVIARVNDNGTMYLVQFDDGDRKWVLPVALRVQAGAPAQYSPPPPPGTRVQGEWTDESWYPGYVAEVSGPMAFVQFDDGDARWVTAAGVRVAGAAPRRAASPALPQTETVTVGPTNVVRCRFCGRATRADREACTACGGPTHG